MNIAIILAGGTGSRMNLSIPKQFLEINKIPIIAHTLISFQNASLIDKIIVVSLEQYFDKIKSIINDYNITKYHYLVKNGDTRQNSVFNALSYLKDIAKDKDIVLIHDGVRAMIDKDIIDKCILETEKYDLTTLADKSKNTIALANKNLDIENFLDREYIYNIQTPQNFRFNIIHNSHISAIEKGYTNITDDTQIAMLNNYKVHIIENEKPNFKLTTKKDIALFEYHLNKSF